MTYQNEFLKYTSKIQIALITSLLKETTHVRWIFPLILSFYVTEKNGVLFLIRYWKPLNLKLSISRNQAGLVHDLGKNLICRTALAFVSRHLEEWEHLMSSSDHAAK